MTESSRSMKLNRLHRVLACGAMAVGALSATLATAVTPAGASTLAVPHGRVCTPGEYTSVTAYTTSFLAGHIQGAFFHNTTGGAKVYPAGQYSVNGNTSYETSWTGSLGAGVSLGDVLGALNDLLELAEAQRATGHLPYGISGSISVTASITKSTGWAINSQSTNPVPNGDYIIYQAGSVSVVAHGVTQWVNQSCQVTSQSNWSVNVPINQSTNFTIQNTISATP